MLCFRCVAKCFNTIIYFASFSLVVTCLSGIFIEKPVATVAVAEALFATREIKASVEPGVRSIDLSFEFKNTGDFPLAVEKFVQSCGCMVGEWDGNPVEPGASGKIKAKFRTDGLRGKVRKSLHVKFFDRGSVELVAEVTIPEAISYSAQTLRWDLGSEARAQQIEITVHTHDPLHVLSVSANDPSFVCTLETMEDGRRYRVTLIPRDTDVARVCVLQVKTDAKDPRDALQGLFALVEKSTTIAPAVQEGRQQ